MDSLRLPLSVLFLLLLPQATSGGCAGERQDAINNNQRPVPQCQEDDGEKYESMQCDDEWCWCVSSKDGKMWPGSKVRAASKRGLRCTGAWRGRRGGSGCTPPKEDPKGSSINLWDPDNPIRITGPLSTTDGTTHCSWQNITTYHTKRKVSVIKTEKAIATADMEDITKRIERLKNPKLENFAACCKEFPAHFSRDKVVVDLWTDCSGEGAEPQASVANVIATAAIEQVFLQKLVKAPGLGFPATTRDVDTRLAIQTAYEGPQRLMGTARFRAGSFVEFYVTASHARMVVQLGNIESEDIRWMIHSTPMDEGDACPPADDAAFDPLNLGSLDTCGEVDKHKNCRVGDLTGKHGLLFARNPSQADHNLPLEGWGSVVGRTLVLGTDPVQCATIGSLMEPRLEAVFSGGQVEGRIVLRQDTAGEDLQIHSSLSASKDGLSEVRAFIYTGDCSDTGEVYNPYEAIGGGCPNNPTDDLLEGRAVMMCAVGNLAGKHGPFPATGKALFTDPWMDAVGSAGAVLPSTGGWGGRSIVLEDGAGVKVVCANLKNLGGEEDATVTEDAPRRQRPHVDSAGAGKGQSDAWKFVAVGLVIVNVLAVSILALRRGWCRSAACWVSTKAFRRTSVQTLSGRDSCAQEAAVQG